MTLHGKMFMEISHKVHGSPDMTFATLGRLQLTRFNSFFIMI